MKINFTLLICVVLLAISSVLFLKPAIQGDGDTYFEAMEVLKTGSVPDGFVPNRILTTFLGLETALFFIKFLGSINGWLLMNVVFYLLSSVLFYNLLIKIFESEKVALISTILLASNYAMLKFGLNFLMDIGGWAFYVISLLFVFIYLETKTKKYIFWTAISVGIGGLFKEYAFLGAIPLFVALLYENRKDFKLLIRNNLLPFTIITVPTLLLHVFVYRKFGYTYFDWLDMNQDIYVYTSRLTEYVKSLGSLLNLTGLIFCFGAWFLYKEWGVIDEKRKLFLISVGMSVLPIFLWPAITQRVLFVILPFIIIVSGFFIKKHEEKWYLFLPFLVLYILINFTMDSFILQAVNLPF